MYKFVIHFFHSTAIPQLRSIPLSFLSLSFASIKLFYSQRIGSFGVADPSPAMVLFVAPFVIGLIMGDCTDFVTDSDFGANKAPHIIEWPQTKQDKYF